MAPFPIRPKGRTEPGEHAQVTTSGSRLEAMVGPGRLELPTSRLSGVRSNHLSYGPVPTIRQSFDRQTQDDLAAELIRGRKRDEDGDIPPKA